MPETKMDRRVKRTRKLLLDSLTHLLEEKDLKDITVKEISEYSDLNRGTFYLHYKDVFDMMEQIQKDLFDDFNRILDENIQNGNNDCPYPVLYQTFHFLYENKSIAKVLMGPHGDYQFILSLQNLVKEHIAKIWVVNKYKEESFDFFYHYSISGILGLIQYWLKAGCKQSPTEMAQLVTDILTKELTLFNYSND